MTSNQSPHHLIVSASLLAADLMNLQQEIDNVSEAGADWLHIDVMDNHYVPNLLFGPALCQSIKKVSNSPLDIHLMTEKVDSLIQPFANVGARILTFHPDTTTHVHRVVEAIKQAGMQVGVAINPAMPIACLSDIIDSIDLILLMTVNPGFGGQSFIPSVLSKIIATRQWLDKRNLSSVRLSVDGGINPKNAKLCQSAGADTLVVGSGIFHTNDYTSTINCLRG